MTHPLLLSQATWKSVTDLFKGLHQLDTKLSSKVLSVGRPWSILKAQVLAPELSMNILICFYSESIILIIIINIILFDRLISVDYLCLMSLVIGLKCLICLYIICIHTYILYIYIYIIYIYIYHTSNHLIILQFYVLELWIIIFTDEKGVKKRLNSLTRFFNFSNFLRPCSV